MNTNQMYERRDPLSVSQISWGAILAGVIIGLASQSLFNFLGLGLGFAAFSMDMDSLAALGGSAVLWLAIAGIVTMLIGGWISGWFANTTCRFNGALHGITTWALASLITFTLAASAAGSFVGGTAHLFGQSVSVVTQGAAKAGKGLAEFAPQATKAAKEMFPDTNAAINKVIKQVDQTTSRSLTHSNDDTAANDDSADQNKEEIREAVTSLLNANKQDTDSARKKVVEVLTQHTNMTAQEVEKTVSDWQESYKQAKEQLDEKIESAKEKTKEVTNKATDVASSIAFTTFFMFLLSGVAAAIGGAMGTSAQSRKAQKS